MTTSPPLGHDRPAPVAPAPRRGSALAVSIATIVVGGIAIVGTLAGSAFTAMSTLRGSDGGSSTGAVEVSGLTDLDVAVTGGALTVVYDDVEQARLDVPAGGSWTFERHGERLRVASPDRGTPGVGFGQSATLVLPRSLEGSPLGARVDVTGGDLDLTGDFDDLEVDLTGGRVTLGGNARSLDLTVSGGSASAELTDVSTASFDLSGGQLSAQLGGSTPRRTEVSVAAGSGDITLPDDEYRVTTDSGFGAVDNRLRTSSSATAEVSVRAEMGSVSLRS